MVWPAASNLLQDFRIVGRVLADRKENAGRALVRQRLQHRGRIERPRAVVERQHHFIIAQEIELLEVLETEARSARGVDLDDAGDAERIGICAGAFAGAGAGAGGRAPPSRRRGVLGGGGLRPGRACRTQRNRACKDQSCRNTHLVLPLP